MLDWKQFMWSLTLSKPTTMKPGYTNRRIRVNIFGQSFYYIHIWSGRQWFYTNHAVMNDSVLLCFLVQITCRQTALFEWQNVNFPAESENVLWLPCIGTNFPTVPSNISTYFTPVWKLVRLQFSDRCVQTLSSNRLLRDRFSCTAIKSTEMQIGSRSIGSRAQAEYWQARAIFL